MAQEIELKLDLTPDAALSLTASELLSGDFDTAKLESVYFDTPDHALAAAGAALRIRRKGRTRVQTVKADRGDAAGLFAHSEWECKVPDDTPVLDDRTPIAALLGERTRDLAPLFSVRYTRRTWNLEQDDNAVEVAVDIGEVIAGDRHAPFAEVELELKRGTPDALFALAHAIAAQTPVRLGVIGKAERGYQLLAHSRGAAFAERVALDPEAAAEAVLRRIANACVRHFRLNEMRLLDGSDEEAIHQARVALRRLRTALRVFREMLADARFEPMEREARWLVGALGAARDIQILIERSAPGPLRDALERARAEAEDRARAALDSARARAFPLDLCEWLTNGSWTADAALAARRCQSARLLAAKALERGRRRVRKRARNLDECNSAERHRARKAAKQLRYAAEFFAPLFDTSHARRRYARLVSPLKRLQEQLGTLNDLAVAPDVLDRLGLARAPDASKLLRHGHEQRHVRAAIKAYDALMEAKRFWR